jgi:hypothetical protein
MVMVGQHKRLSEPLLWTRGSKIALASAIACALAALVAVIIVASANAPKHRAGCIEMTFASTLGAAFTHACGTKARQMCADPSQTPGLAAHGVLRQACSKAGLPYGTL